MSNFVSKFKEKVLNREMITYLLGGVGTTLVNWGASFLFRNIFGFEDNVTNVIAWILAVIFAYLVNNYWVFRTGNQGGKSESIKFVKFIVSRIFTFVLEIGIPFVFVTLMDNPGWYWPVKIITAVIVTVLNFIFGKFVVFIKSKGSYQEAPEGEETR